MSQCRVYLIHPDKSQSRCLLDADHLLDDSDHLDEHGHTAKVLVSQATIREVKAWSKIPFPWEQDSSDRTPDELLAHAFTLLDSAESMAPSASWRKDCDSWLEHYRKFLNGATQ